MIFINDKQFHLQTPKTSYIFEVSEQTGELMHLYYGNKLPKDAKLQHTNLNMFLGESPTPDRAVYYYNMSREYPSYGRSDYREGTIHIQNELHGDTVINLEYDSYSIIKKCPNIPNLPHTRNTEDDSQTISIFMKDNSLGLEVELLYTVCEESDVIVRSAIIRNKGTANLKILSALSLALDIRSDKNWELITLNGTWARERKLERTPISYGIHNVSSTQGNSSSSFHNPFGMIVRPHTTESSGEAIATSLIYSGNHKVQIELTPMNDLRMMIGINPFDFNWTLSPNEEFITPQAVLCYSDQGMGAVSRELHRFVQNRIINQKWKNHQRYTLINNWEGTYFDFNEDKIVDMAAEAQKLGIELFVLDDGWFGHRDDDHTSLGDWFVYRSKLPNGIQSLSKRVTDLGIKFGLWFEPEMINEDSELFKNNPEWRIECPRYKPCQGRNQYVLDMTREDVQEYLFDMISKILQESEIAYVKWDKNRNLTDIMSYDLPKDKQKEFVHRYMLGLYKLIDRLVTEFPDVLFESCSAGGNRFDLGMLYYMPQTWTSDNTDAIQRLDIQWGTSMCYPVSTMGAHVSACPNHQTARITPIQLRGAVALFGTFGYELDPIKMPQEEKEIVKQQVKAFKKHRNLISHGDFYRMQSPETNVCSWGVVSTDQSEALVMVIRILSSANPTMIKVQIPNLIPNDLYSVEELGITAYGSELMHSGIWMPVTNESIKETDLKCFCSWSRFALDPCFADFSGMVFYIKKI